jgi:hypothetical protein
MRSARTEPVFSPAVLKVVSATADARPSPFWTGHDELVVPQDKSPSMAATSSKID